jgi:hypothetical protein
MAITTNAITNSFKEDLLQGTQVFAAGAGNTFKLALYTSAATIGADTTSYAVGIAGQVGDTGTIRSRWRSISYCFGICERNNSFC